MSDRLTLSAALSVLLMTAYVLFGGDTARASFAPAGLEAPIQVSAGSLPTFKVVLAQTGTRRILY